MFKQTKEQIKKLTKKIGIGVLAITVILASGFMLGGFFIGNGVYQSMTTRTVTVKGLAEKDVKADTAIWNIKISRVGDNLSTIQKNIDIDIAKIKDFLMDAGFIDLEIKNSRVQVRDKYAGYSVSQIKEQTGSDNRYVIETGVFVRSHNVALVDEVSRRMGELIKQGVTITEDYAGPTYLFNGLNSIKISMIKEATKNATIAGEQFAIDADAKLGEIKSANQGVFTVTARDPIDAWSNNEKQAIDKKVRVVTTITFYLR